MERREVPTLTPDDDRFHPYSDHPDETETFWVSFHDPERRLGGWFYNQVLFNQGICNGGAWVWDDTEDVAALHEVMERGLPLGDTDALDLRDVELPNGNHLQMLEPLTRYRVRRRDPGVFDADLSFEGLRAPHSHPIGVAPFWKGRHFDQAMHVTGQIELLGETIEIDSLSVRDRSWGPRPGRRSGTRSDRPRARRDPADAARPPYSPWGIGYLFGTQDADEMFLAYTLPCIFDGDARDFVTAGYLVRDGVYGALVGGDRRCEFDPEHEWMRTIWLEAVDEHGRELTAVGHLVSHHGTHGQGTGYFRWEWDGTRGSRDRGYGEDQSNAQGPVLDALRAAGLWT